MPFYLLMLAGVAAGYYVGIAVLKWMGKPDTSLIPVVTAVVGGLAGYGMALAFAPTIPAGDIVWAEPVLQVYNQDELDAVLADRPEQSTLVDFYANWCGPCRAASPGLNEMALAGERIVVVNVERSPTLADRYNVKVLPTSLIFVGGEEVHRARGRHSKRALQKLMSATGS